MPEKIKCSKCGHRISVKNFPDQMEKLRRHYKKVHPKLFKKSVYKGIQTRRKSRS